MKHYLVVRKKQIDICLRDILPSVRKSYIFFLNQSFHVFGNNSGEQQVCK